MTELARNKTKYTPDEKADSLVISICDFSEPSTIDN